jgi:hypothetical protein
MINNILVKQIPTELTYQFMPLVKDHIEAGLADSDLNYEQARVFLTNGSWMLLIALDDNDDLLGAYIIAFSNNPSDRIATIVSAAGRGLASQSAFDQICEIAKSYGATKIQALAKQSAARLYKRVGLSERASLMEKKL